jgi:hypothetical protein
MLEVSRVSALSKIEFYNKYVKKSQPVIFTDIAKEWRGVKTWSLDFFQQKYGEKEASIMRLKDGKADPDTYSDESSNHVPVSTIIKEVKKGISKTSMVLASSTDPFYPELEKDIEIPVYCKGGKFFRSRIYIGPKGLVTTLHQDLPENLYVVAVGSKHITLFPPGDRKWLYANSIFSKHPNFARYNPDEPDATKFPLAKNAHPLEVHLQAGEVLYIPSLWWHHIRNTEDSIALNFWWSVGWKTVVAWGAALYKKIYNHVA